MEPMMQKGHWVCSVMEEACKGCNTALYLASCFHCSRLGNLALKAASLKREDAK